MTLLCGQSSNLHMLRLLNFINSISWTDHIRDVSARTVGGQVYLLAPRGGRPTAPTPLGYRPPTPLGYRPRISVWQ